MKKYFLKCFLLSICLICLSPDYSKSGERKTVLLEDPEVEVLIEKNLKEKLKIVAPEPPTKYSMRIIKPDPNTDPKIVKNTFDPNVDYKLRIIDLFTKKKITGLKRPLDKAILQELQEKGKRYETPETKPHR